jgi:hypothetical protein
MIRYAIRCSLMAACCVLLVEMCSAQSSGASLGDVARQGKAHKKAKIVIGDDDVAHSTDLGSLASSPDPSDNSSVDADQTQATDPKSKAAGHVASKGGPTSELQKKIDKAKSDEAMYQQAMKTAQERASKAQTEFQREVAQEAIENNQKNVEIAADKRKKLEAQQKDAQGAPKD